MNDEADRIVGLYDRHALAWDRARAREGRPLEAVWLDRFLTQLPPRASVLDLGCGAGEPIARYLIGKGCRLTGIDSSPTLIGFCRTRFPDQEWLLADMRTLALPRCFQGILAWDSFFHLTPADQRRMFSIFQLHAAEDAVLMFTSGTQHGEVLGEFQGEPLYHGSLDEDEYRQLLAQSGFAVVAYTADDPDCGHHTVWLAARRGNLTPPASGRNNEDSS